MSITYPVTIPTCMLAARVNWGMKSSVAISQSEYTHEQQAQEYEGTSWVLDIGLPPLSADDARDMIAFLGSLNGPVGTFQFGIPLMRTPRGVATGTPEVNGGTQTGQELITNGWSSSVTNIMRKGDFIQVDNRLYVILKDVNSDGSGNATLDIWPKIINPPADSTTIITSDPKGLFRLAENLNNWSADKERIYDFPIRAVEVL